MLVEDLYMLRGNKNNLQQLCSDDELVQLSA